MLHFLKKEWAIEIVREKGSVEKKKTAFLLKGHSQSETGDILLALGGIRKVTIRPLSMSINLLDIFQS